MTTSCTHIEHAIRGGVGRVGRIDAWPYDQWESCPDLSTSRAVDGTTGAGQRKTNLADPYIVECCPHCGEEFCRTGGPNVSRRITEAVAAERARCIKALSDLIDYTKHTYRDSPSVRHGVDALRAGIRAIEASAVGDDDA